MKSHLRQSGFTLLELIVVLMIVSFISVLLMQGLTYVSKVNDSFLGQGTQRQHRMLAMNWFRDAVSNLVLPEADEQDWRFKGDERSFEGATLQAADRRYGIPARFAFRLEDNPRGTQFIYVRMAENSRWPLIQLEGKAVFHYLDQLGQWQPKWPPSPNMVDMLPLAVVLESPQDNLYTLVNVALPTRRVINRNEKFE